MPKIVIVYFSKTGNTKLMADLTAQGAFKAGAAEVKCVEVEKVTFDDLLSSDAIIIGSPTYYGSMASPIKKLFDDSILINGKLVGKVGAAFSSSAFIGGGNETTILDILRAMLVHGMIIQGDFKRDHFGPVAINKPDERSQKLCLRLGTRVVDLVKKLQGK